MSKMIFILSIYLMSLNSYSQENPETKEGPCRKLIEACKNADFAKGDESMKKTLYKDCMNPLLADPTSKIQGVTIDSSIIVACKALKEAKLKTK